jgi:hypothetical protein
MKIEKKGERESDGGERVVGVVGVVSVYPSVDIDHRSGGYLSPV